MKKTPFLLQTFAHLSLILGIVVWPSQASTLDDHIRPHEPHDVETPPSTSPTTAAPSSMPSLSPTMIPSSGPSMRPSLTLSSAPSLTQIPSSLPSGSPVVESNIFANSPANINEDPDPVEVSARGDDGGNINMAPIVGIAAGGFVLLVGGFVARRRGRKQDLQSKGYFDFDPDDSFNQSTSSDEDVEV